MKKFLSLTLAILMIVMSIAIFPSSAAEATFKEGDVLYLKIVSPEEWESNNPIMYVNFTSYSRADNGGKSVIIADADKSKYNPRTGVEYIESSDL